MRSYPMHVGFFAMNCSVCACFFVVKFVACTTRASSLLKYDPSLLVAREHCHCFGVVMHHRSFNHCYTLSCH